jgi:hypothetical protein
MLQQTIHLKWEDFEFSLNRRQITTDLELILTANARAQLIFTVGRHYVVELQDDRLVKHLFYTENRSVADVQKGLTLISRTGGIAAHRQMIEWDDLELTVGGQAHTISPVTTVTNIGVGIRFRFGRRVFNIHIPNLSLVRHVGEVTGRSAESSLRARRFI